MRVDLLHVVEAAYHLDGSASHWLQGLTDTVGPLIDAGHGAYGTTIDASSGTGMRVGRVHRYGGDPAFVRAIRSMNSALTTADIEDTYRGVPAITTATERVGSARWDSMADQHGPAGIRDCAAVIAANAMGVGSMVIAPLNRAHRFSLRTKRVWSRVVAHLVAMQRLRASLARAGGRERAEGEAVLDPDGRVEHAVGPARADTARALLRTAAIRRERARGRLRREAPEEAVEMWQALVAGRWSIVDRFDNDGRRFLIAHENEPEAAAQRALTTREQQVVIQAALGHSNKLIGYELGLSVGGVSAYLNSAMRKLGLASRVDLARLLWAARRSPQL